MDRVISSYYCEIRTNIRLLPRPLGEGWGWGEGDGRGEFHHPGWLSRHARYSGISSALLDEQYFRQVRVDLELGTIVWPNGADICPDVLYSFASGKPIIVNGERVLN